MQSCTILNALPSLPSLLPTQRHSDLCPRTHTACARRPRLLGLQFQRILRLQENIMQILCRAIFYHTVLTANPTPFQPILQNSQRLSSISTRQHPTSLKHACTKSKPPTKFFKTQHFAFAVANTAHLQSMPFSMQRPCSTSSPQLPTCQRLTQTFTNPKPLAKTPHRVRPGWNQYPPSPTITHLHHRTVTPSPRPNLSNFATVWLLSTFSPQPLQADCVGNKQPQPSPWLAIVIER